MEMIVATKILQRKAARIGKLGGVNLPRSIELPTLLAGAAGLTAGLLISIPFSVVFGSTTLLLMGAVGGSGLAIALLRWQPWKGESVMSVLRVRVNTIRGTTTTTCPGSAREMEQDGESGTWSCCECGLIATRLTDGSAQTHQWKRRFYIGIRSVATPTVGVVNIAAGALAPFRTQHGNTRNPR